MKKELVDYIAELLTRAQDAGFKLSDEREINYGVQLKFEKNREEIPLNVYYSQKKGISTVVGGSQKNPLRPQMQKLLNLAVDVPPAEHSWKKWAGTDESGKGDFFGPLVVCGFIATEAMLPELRKVGVKDSKLLKDKEIVVIAKNLYKHFAANIEVLALNPLKYNELYHKFRQNNQKLNEMLAWMHGRVIMNLKEKHSFQGAVVDKFASDRTLVSALKGLKDVELLHKTKAEDDLAVAAASIIARYHFLMMMESMNRKYGMTFPKGASAKVLNAGKEFVDKFGKQRLIEVSKTHFQTYNKI